jgi:tetratricopeptide (TPR) repeat protein
VIVCWAIGVLLFAASLGAQTIEQLHQAVRLNPSDAESHGRLGIALRKAGRLPDAAASLSRAVELSPDPRLKVLLAFTYIELAQCDRAVPLLKESFDLEQKDPVKLAIGQRLVECTLSSRRPEEALSYLQTLRRLAPDDPNVLYLASKVYMSMWNEAFQTLITKAPNSYHVRLIQAEALEAQERFGEAAHEYRSVLKIEPQLTDIRYRLGRALLLSQPDGKADAEAQAEFRKVLEANPVHTAALTDLGDIHLRNGQREEASKLFTKAIEVQPVAVPARVGLAKVHIAEKQWPKALEQLEAAAKIAPAEEGVYYNLMLAYRGLGRQADAKQALETFERLKKQKGQQGATFLKSTQP